MTSWSAFEISRNPSATLTARDHERRIRLMIIDDHIGDIKTRLISSGPHRVRPIGDTQGENGHGDADDGADSRP